jgi:hypothetical protein
MATGGYQVPDADNRLLEMIRTLQEQVKSLQDKRLFIPTLQQDPDANDMLNLWFLDDGRLRGRLRDGTIKQFASEVPGGSTSTAPPPPAQYQPTEKTLTVQATWFQSYSQGGGVQQGGPYLGYGWQTSAVGEEMSMIGFADIRPQLAASVGYLTQIKETWIHLINKMTQLEGGTELRVGLHNESVAPVIFQEWWFAAARPHVSKETDKLDKWYQVSNSIGEAFRDGKALGLTLHQGSTDPALWGQASPFAEIKIVFLN